MQITVKKTDERPEIIVKRSDGTRWALRDPTRKYLPPHDIIHIVVEATLGLDDGFFGTIASGGVFNSMNHIDGRLPPHARTKAEARVRSNAEGLRRAECIVSGFGTDFTATNRPAPTVRRDRMAAFAELGVHRESVRKVWSHLLQARQDWVSLATGGTLIFTWPSTNGAQRYFRH